MHFRVTAPCLCVTLKTLRAADDVLFPLLIKVDFRVTAPCLCVTLNFLDEIVEARELSKNSKIAKLAKVY